MSEADGETNADQKAFWQEAGVLWAEHQAGLDALFAGVLDRVLTRAAPGPGERVIDVGCGAGASTLAAAERVGPGGRVLGLDVSPPLLKLAMRRIEGMRQAALMQADAQTAELGRAAFEAVISRFGVMFFDDPAAAFANLRAALVPGGRIAFAAWAAPEANPWFGVPRRAAEARLGPAEPPEPGAPGPFAFADPARPAAILAEAGFCDVEIRTEAIPLRHPGGAGTAAALATSIGAAGRLLRERGGTEADAEAIRAAVTEAFSDHESGGVVAVPASIHMVHARVA